MTEAVILAALQAYSKTIDLIVAVRADMPEAERRKEWEKHFARLQWWEDLFKPIFAKLPNDGPTG